MNPPLASSLAGRWRRAAPGLAVWALAGVAMALLDGHFDLANLALLLVLAAALSALWLPAPALLLGSAAAVLAFNWFFVPPRGSFSVQWRQHALLLVAMLGVSWVVSLLVARLSRAAAREKLQSRRARQLQALGELLRDSDDLAAQAQHLQQALAEQGGGPVRLLVPKEPLPALNDTAACLLLGEPESDTLAGLWLCLRSAQALGPGTGRDEDQPEGEARWFLPLRGRSAAFGAAALPVAAGTPGRAEALAHAQALCDQVGLALERAAALHAAAAARDEAQSQRLRNTLLAAISHDYRTPLATILGAASSLHDQGERLGPEQRQRLAATVVDEARQLSRLTDNTLQLARLETPGLALNLDWESAEEIVGSVLRRARAADPGRRLRARLEAGLPLLRCDAVLLVQLLDNLVDNALKYSPEGSPVELVVRRGAGSVVLSVADRGPGIAPGWRERIFTVFQRGDAGPGRRGAGVGLAVCRAIARAHGGTLTLRARKSGGTAFEITLPAPEPPEPPAPLGAEAATP